MRIAVTGALGFLGGHFVESALAGGHLVSALHRPSSTGTQRLIHGLQARGVEFHAGDVGDIESLRPVMRNAECVCHFAAAFRETGVPDDFFLASNVTGTRNVIEAAASQGVRRFVFCSTAGIYGSRIPGVADETAEVKPANIYERSKVEAEKVVRELTASLQMEYVIMRPAVVYGPHDRRLLKMFKAASKGRFPRFGSGSGRRHMVYVGDVADAALRACVLQAAAGQEMIIAGPQALPLRDILDRLARSVNRSSCGPRLPLWPMMALAAVTEDLCKLMGIKPPIYRRRMDFYLNDAEFDCARASKVLGWNPAVDLDEGFRRTVASYRQDGWI